MQHSWPDNNEWQPKWKYQLPGILRSGEQNHPLGVDLLLQLHDDVVEFAVVGGARYFLGGGDANVALLRLPVEHLDAVLAVGALRIDGGDVRPVNALDDVDQGAGLEGVGRHGAGEVLETALVAQRLGGGGRRYLRYVEEAEQVGHLQRDGAVRAADHAEHRAGVVDSGTGHRVVVAFQGWYVDVVERGPHELQTLVQGVGVAWTGVQYVHSQRDVRQYGRIVVDAIYGEHHCLQSLHASMVDLRATCWTFSWNKFISVVLFLAKFRSISDIRLIIHLNTFFDYVLRLLY